MNPTPTYYMATPASGYYTQSTAQPLPGLTLAFLPTSYHQSSTGFMTGPSFSPPATSGTNMIPLASGLEYTNDSSGFASENNTRAGIESLGDHLYAMNPSPTYYMATPASGYYAQSIAQPSPRFTLAFLPPYQSNTGFMTGPPFSSPATNATNLMPLVSGLEYTNTGFITRPPFSSPATSGTNMMPFASGLEYTNTGSMTGPSFSSPATSGANMMPLASDLEFTNTGFNTGPSFSPPATSSTNMMPLASDLEYTNTGLMTGSSFSPPATSVMRLASGLEYTIDSSSSGFASASSSNESIESNGTTLSQSSEVPQLTYPTIQVVNKIPEHGICQVGMSFYENGKELPFICNTWNAQQIARLQTIDYQYYVPPQVDSNDYFGGQLRAWATKFQEHFSTFVPDVWTLQGLPELRHPLGPGKWYQDNMTSKLRFCCRKCKRPWTSMRGKVGFFFNYDFPSRRGYAFVKIFAQGCNQPTCADQGCQPPACYPEEIDKTIWKLSQFIGYIFYKRPFCQEIIKVSDKAIRDGHPQSQHRRELCQACKHGLCSQSGKS